MVHDPISNGMRNSRFVRKFFKPMFDSERDPVTTSQVTSIPDSESRIVQRTLKNEIDCTGIGLHSGARIAMTLRPAAPDTGILFRRTDVAGDAALVPARWDMVGDTRLCTALVNHQGVRVGTVEHLMAAFAGCGVDNAIVEVDGPEVPVMDGSSAPFVFLIECAGVVGQNATRRAIRVLAPVVVTDGPKRAALLPGEGFSLDVEIDFASRAVAHQNCSFRLAEGSFKRELARARTFGFMHEVEYLRSVGLARGGSLENAVVVNGDRILNEGGLRYDDEFVRHKVLDAIGDLYLAGAPIVGRFEGVQSGHHLNNELLRRLFATEGAWCWVRAPREGVTRATSEQRSAELVAFGA